MTIRQHIRTISILLIVAIIAIIAGGYYLTRPDVATLPLEAVQGGAPQLV